MMLPAPYGGVRRSEPLGNDFAVRVGQEGP
jgi:hypothetical protein